MSATIEGRHQTYLGDGAYATLDSYGAVWVYTSNGDSVTNKVCLELSMVKELLKFVEEHEEQ